MNSSEQTPDSNGTLSKKKVECLICQGNHYANLCPSKSKAVSKSSGGEQNKLMTITVDSSDTRPFIELEVSKEKLVTLLDTGSDSNYISEEIVNKIG